MVSFYPIRIGILVIGIVGAFLAFSFFGFVAIVAFLFVLVSPPQPPTIGLLIVFLFLLSPGLGILGAIISYFVPKVGGVVMIGGGIFNGAALALVSAFNQVPFAFEIWYSPSALLFVAGLLSLVEAMRSSIASSRVL